MNTHVSIGHNNPPDPIDAATAPWESTRLEAENWADGDPVSNEDQMKAVDALLKDVKAAKREISKARDAETKPLHAAWKDEIERWKPTLEDFDNLAERLVKAVAPFKQKLADEKRAAEREAWEKAEKARKAAEEAERSAKSIDDMREAAAAKQAVIDAEKAAQAARKDSVKGLRKVTRHAITDMGALVNWIAANDKPALADFATEYARKNCKAQAMNGVRVWEEKEAF